jgi:hypothetical protein
VNFISNAVRTLVISVAGLIMVDTLDDIVGCDPDSATVHEFGP